MPPTNVCDFFTPSEDRNFCFIVENRNFYVSKEVLSLQSAVFKTMFYGNFKESRRQSIELPDKKWEEFLEFLNCVFVCKTRKEIDETNVAILLLYADEYDTVDLKVRCRLKLESMAKTLTVDDTGLIFQLFYYSIKYRFKELFKICFPYVACQNKHTVLSHRDEFPGDVLNLIAEAKGRRRLLEHGNHDMFTTQVYDKCVICKNNCFTICSSCSKYFCRSCQIGNWMKCNDFHVHTCLKFYKCTCGYDFDEKFLSSYT